MEGVIANWYATNTGKSIDEFAQLAKRVAGELAPGSSVLEVAPGPGFFCIELAKTGIYSITGLDISHTFVEMAQKKAAEAGLAVNFRQGNASSMPFADNTFDFLLCRAAFKNFGQPVRALQEMCRVLKPGGRGLIIDLNRDVSMDAIHQAVDEMHLDAVNRVFTKLTFRFFLIRTAYTRTQFEQMLAQAKFSTVNVREAGIGFEISMTK